MLKHGKTNGEGLAWLLEGEHSRCLSVEGRSVSPPSGKLSFFAPDFSMSAGEPWLVGEQCDFSAWSQVDLPQLIHRAEPSPAEFARIVEEILLRIGQGEFEKVVPMVREEFEFAADLRRQMFYVADGPPEHQFSYGFEFQREGMVGQTPELLFAVRDGELQTMALAGTGRVDGPSLLDDRKERHEHNLVIEHILTELKDWGVADVGQTIERPYGLIKHLYTPIRVSLSRPVEFMELVVRLHPTAALGGWPRRPAIEWLERQEFHMARGRFGAPFGYCNPNEMLCVVAIRGLQWSGARASVASGCGVVRESQTLREWEELRLKRQSVFRNLGVSLS